MPRLVPRAGPSGHAALQCSLAFGIVFWWWAAALPRASVVAAVVLPFAVLVGYSRAYLDIHLLSDVLAGWLVAVVAAVVVLVVDRLLAARRSLPPPRSRSRVLVAGGGRARAHGHHRRSRSADPRSRAGSLAERFSGNGRGFGGAAEPDAAHPARRRRSFRDTRAAAALQRRRCSAGGAQPLGLVIVAKGDELGLALEHAGWRPLRSSHPNGYRAISGRASRRGRVWSGPSAGVSQSHRPSTTRERPDIVARPRHGRHRALELPVVTPSGCVVWGGATARDGGNRGWLVAVPAATHPRRRSMPSATRSRERSSRPGISGTPAGSTSCP